jgi:hypothetical protein
LGNGRASQLLLHNLAFFPFLIFVSVLIGFVPVDPELLSKILLESETFLPERTYTWVRDFTIDLVNSQGSGVVSIGILLSLWRTSTAFRGIIGVLNRALAITETRRYLKAHLLAIGMTILVSLFVITSGVLLFLGDWLIQLLIQRITVAPYPSFLGPLASHLLRQLLDPGIEKFRSFRQSLCGLRNLPTTLWKPGHPYPPDALTVPLQLFPVAGREKQLGDLSSALS